MITRRLVLTLVGVAAITVASVAARATDTRAQNLELVAGLDITNSTHMEFMTRTIAEPEGAREHTFVLLGSRDGFAPAGGVADGGLHIIDVTDPEHPVRVAHVRCVMDDNDIAVVHQNHTIDGVAYDTFIALSSNSSSGCLAPKRGPVQLIGIRTVPLAGETLSVTHFGSTAVAPGGARFPWETQAAHTIVAHPTQPVIYVASQRLADRTPSVEVVNLAVWPPVATSVELPPTGVSPHDITFNPNGLRAYASSINLTFVWDTEDPLRPVTIGVMDSANLKVHHEAVLHPDGRHLFVVDEFVNTTSGGVGQCPGGGVHIFDLGPNHELEAAPAHVGQFYAPDVSTPATYEIAGAEIDIGCTAHEFNFAASGAWMPIGWTGAGVRVIDLSSVLDAASLPAPAPVVLLEIGNFVPAGTDMYAAKTHPNLPGYIFASDTEPARNADGSSAGGLRVLRYTGALPTG